jgi:hypothetical protein
MSYPLTLVSGYWIVKNKHNEKYNKWFENSLLINCPYVFFCDNNSIDIIKQYRKDLPTYYVILNINEFYTFKYYNNIATHPMHCPSKELNLIWNEKIFLINKAANLNPFNSEFFGWCDAGLCIFRDTKPPPFSFPNINKLNLLPKDKFIFSSSDYNYFDKSKLSTYYHYVSGTYIINKSIINKFTDIYREYIDKYLSKETWIYTDQVILTLIYNDYQDMFSKFCDGYGMLIYCLY